MLPIRGLFGLLAALAAAAPAAAFLNATETNAILQVTNERMNFIMNKTTGYIQNITLDGVDLLGQHPIIPATCVLYVDGLVTPVNDHYSPVGGYKLLQGTDSAGLKYAGMVISEKDPEGYYGETFEQYWFLRERETSLHAFTRITYANETGEVRTLFRPRTELWTHMSASDTLWLPQPNPNPTTQADAQVRVVQDTTYWLANRTGDPYVEDVADYWTKYTLSERYGNHDVHGIFSDGTTSPDNSTFGAWMVYNSKDTFYGGPQFSDLTVDGILYNYIASNHHGNQNLNITHGFERTWGPSIYHFNRGPPAAGSVGGALNALRKDAKALVDHKVHAQFYDDISTHIPGYVPTSGRGTFKAHTNVPAGAVHPVAVLSAPGLDFQENAHSTHGYQYWANVSAKGLIEIPRVKAGTYRLTLYAEGVFGDFIYENVTVKAGMRVSNAGNIKWVPESAGTELWRIGTPDKSAGEYRHGNVPLERGLGLPEYKQYWGAYDFVEDFPNGVYFKVGESDIATDLNYVHWSRFGQSMTRPDIATENINNWTIAFDLTDKQLQKRNQATLSLQFAGVTTSAGNLDSYNGKLEFQNLPYYVSVNGNELPPHIFPYNMSGSCATRSGVSCYQIPVKFKFPTSYLDVGENKLVLSLPYNATGDAVTKTTINVMHDALRLEVQ